MSLSDERGRKIGHIIGMITLVFGALTWYATREGTDISRKTFERATGRAAPNFEVKCDTRHLLVRAETPIEPKSILIKITNNGTEPIKAIRCDISARVSWAADQAEAQKFTPERLEREFSEILKPGESDEVEILPAVVAYMKTLNPPLGQETYWSLCRVACSVQLVGDSYFTSGPKMRTGDGDSSSTFVSFGMTWEASDILNRQPLNFGIAR